MTVFTWDAKSLRFNCNKETERVLLAYNDPITQLPISELENVVVVTKHLCMHQIDTLTGYNWVLSHISSGYGIKRHGNPVLLERLANLMELAIDLSSPTSELLVEIRPDIAKFKAMWEELKENNSFEEAIEAMEVHYANNHH